MPVLIDVEDSSYHLFARSPAALPAPQRSHAEWIDVGVVNNMPDSALMATERQVLELLAPACRDMVVRLRLYAMPSTPRSEWGRDYVRRYYRSTDEMLDSRLDGVVMTGAEPKALRLADEPYWSAFAELVDWAAENTGSAIFSCLAVHCAVQRADGIERRRLPDKCMGVFVQSRIAEHEMMRGLPWLFSMPHARWNDVATRDLCDCGYSILSESARSGADCFVKRRKNSLFVHFQGHPEYDTHSLLGEYRRDLGRYLRGESEVCPAVPANYFDAESEEIAAAFRQRALAERRPELLAAFPADRLARDLRNVWRQPAGRLYRNWLSHLKRRRLGTARPVAIAQARPMPAPTRGSAAGRTAPRSP